MQFWSSDAGKTYLKQNQVLIERGVRITRIFIIPGDRPLTQTEAEVFHAHQEAGIETLMLPADRAVSIAREFEISQEPDFGLLDDYAVSFWHLSEGRALRISVNEKDIEQCERCFDALVEACTSVTDAAAGLSGTGAALRYIVSTWMRLGRPELAAQVRRFSAQTPRLRPG